MSAAVVAHGRPDIFGNGIEILHQVIDRLRLQIGMALQGLVEVCHISPMVLVMVNFHGFGVYMRFESVEWVR